MRYLENSLNSILNYYGNMIFTILLTEVNLIICLTLILLIVFYYIKKKRLPVKKIVFLMLAVFTILVLLFVIPFERGSYINDLQATGLELVSCINKINQEKGDYPQNIDEIQAFCKIKTDNIQIADSYKYIFVDSKVINEKNKNDKGFKKLEQNSFRIYIESKIVNPDRMYYDHNLGKFVWTD